MHARGAKDARDVTYPLIPFQRKEAPIDILERVRVLPLFFVPETCLFCGLAGQISEDRHHACPSMIGAVEQQKI